MSRGWLPRNVEKVENVEDVEDMEDELDPVRLAIADLVREKRL
ncbi:hypothetical protein QIS99_18815 [Streptomyces sp. B-S-A8]|uniref:Uncharacterized protein n=1 Tax=Streptomyces solicavernae TaxID=3043614 RepID=A0ABT6RX55_9ACTN|nr:hypothetical protein [Streptomyces sp. B-S-A8]MDI3388241.1 hypothetical protein [Streptomyces sp. B-S-A8]